MLACIKRKESKTIGKIAEEMRRPPDSASQPTHIPCKIWDMTSKKCSTKTAAA